MTDHWLLQDIEKHIAQRNRVVIIDPTGEYSYLLPHIKKKHYTILKTDTSNTEEWQRIKEELLQTSIFQGPKCTVFCCLFF